MPFFSRQEATYISPIGEDGTFSFRFPVHASIREVSIRNYAEHLYVHPGDSLYVEINFSDLLSPEVHGTAEALNKYMTLFTEGGSYRKDYPYTVSLPQEEFDSEVKKEYASRLERRNEFLKKYSPGEEVEEYTAELLRIDYYSALFEHAALDMAGKKDVDKCDTLLPQLDSLFSGKTIFANLFGLAEKVNRLQFLKQYAKGNYTPKIDELLEDLKGNAIVPYLYANSLGQSLLSNDTTFFAHSRHQFDSIVQAPHLRRSVLHLYQTKCDFLNNPKKVSDYMLYGRYSGDFSSGKDMSFMAPMHRLLEKYKGKVIYIDFWSITCGPCLAEMNPLKELRKRYAPEDLVMISICSARNGDREGYHKVLKRFSLEGQGIEHIYSEDWATSNEYSLIMNQCDMHSLPQYLLIDREGVISDYGTSLRPGRPQTIKKINSLLR